MYSQQTQSIRRRARNKTTSTQPPFAWSNPAFIAANQQRLITPEQQAMLQKQLNLWPAGCLGYLTFLTFVPIIMLATFLHHNEFLWLYILTFGLPLLALLLTFQRRAALLRAAEQGFITQEQGEIIWQENGYVARTITRQLTTVAGQTLPPPGPYHFYYLTGSAILLSADPIRTATGMFASPGTLSDSGLSGQEQARLALQQALCSTLAFSPYDLDCNRMHMLSADQRRRLMSKLVNGIIGSLVSIPIGVAVGIWAFAFSSASKSPGDPIGIFLFLFSAGIILTALYRLTFGVRARYRAIRNNALEVISGPLRSRKVGGGEDADTYYYESGSTSLQVSQSAYDALIPGMLYRLYYLPHMNVVLSIEPLEAPPR